jgi:aminoglycoside phosphotransferase (APT) family kinase protein
VGKHVPSVDAVAAFLSDLHREEVTGLEPLSGGYWSSAYGYAVGGRELVLRLGDMPEAFEIDRAAMAYDGPDLPVPEVLDIGEALGLSYAVSVRHHGRFLETVRPDEADRAGPAIVRLLEALRAVPAEDGPSWREWLASGFVDDPGHRVSGWRATLAADPELDALFRRSEQVVRTLSGACPERRDLIHGDLLHANVLVAEDASRVTAVFSWKCSVRGDFLFDVAWCTFWAPWYPGVVAADVWGRMSSAADVEGDEAWADAALRHHCYEVRIGGAHLGWHAWTGDAEGLRSVAARLVEVLERGPLAGPEALR